MTAPRRTHAPRGRRPDDRSRREVAAVLGEAARRPDLLVEYLHRLHDGYGELKPRHLVALAEALGVAPVQVYEVATFYAHFEITGDDDEDAEAPPVVRVCTGLTCAMHGADALHAALEARLAGRARVRWAPCLGRCEQAPAVLAGKAALAPATAAGVEQAIADGRTGADASAAPNLVMYSLEGGYQHLRACLDGRHAPHEVIAAIEAAGLRGLGGAGFPTARKWRTVRGQAGPRFLVVNADESEPGTFKDRFLLETNPHAVLEGMLLAAWAVDAAEVFIYLRDEHHHLHAMLARELTSLEAAGLSGGRALHLRRGAGAYVCGEESAMLESIEGRRGLPRQRPPYVAERGLFGRPTLVNNVETLYWAREIIVHGPETWTRHGRNGHVGRRAFSVSGRVRAPGVKIAPNGISLRQLVDEHCDGMAEGHALGAFLPGGASGGIFPAGFADEPLAFGTFEPHGGFLGAGGIVVLSARDDLRAVARHLAAFFAHESCGQCAPCRLGTERATRLLEPPRWDAAALEDLGAAMADASICGLGQAAPNVWRTLLRHFPEVAGR